MSFSPIAFIAPNYRDFKNEWLKAYSPGTTTPKPMALESNGGTQVAKLQLNADGFIVSAGDALVIPYIDGAYDLWLFPTEFDADNNITANAIRVADDITGVSDSSITADLINDLSQAYIFDTVALFKASLIQFPDDKTIHLNDRDADFTKIMGQSGDGYGTIPSTSVSQSIVYDPSAVVKPRHLGVTGGADDTLALDALFSLDLPTDMGSIEYKYLKATHGVGVQNLPRVMFGEGWTLKCIGSVEFGMLNNHEWSGGTFDSDDVITCDPLLARSASDTGTILIAAVEVITKAKIHCDFIYSAADYINGTLRGEGFIRVYTTTDPADYDWDCNISGSILAIDLGNIGGKQTGKISFENCETGYNNRSGCSLVDLDLTMINTPLQIDNFRNMTDVVPSVNGKDTYLSSTSGTTTKKTKLRVLTAYAVERAIYCQAGGFMDVVSVSDGCDAVRTVGPMDGGVIRGHAVHRVGGSTQQQYAVNVQGDLVEGADNLHLYPVCENLTGVPGNKVAFSLQGHCNNITVHEPYSYECGNGLFLNQALGGTFEVQIDGLTILGGRAEGANGVTPVNGAIQAWFNTPNVGEFLKDLTVIGTTSMPSSSGSGTFRIQNTTGLATVQGVRVDGNTSQIDYDNHVIVTNNVSEVFDNMLQQLDNFNFTYPRALIRTDFAVNAVSAIVFATTPTINANTIRVVIRGRHNGQPQNCYLEAEFLIQTSSVGSVVIDVKNFSSSSQSATAAFDVATGNLTINYTSTTGLAFDASTFFTSVESVDALTLV